MQTWPTAIAMYGNTSEIRPAHPCSGGTQCERPAHLKGLCVCLAAAHAPIWLHPNCRYHSHAILLVTGTRLESDSSPLPLSAVYCCRPGPYQYQEDTERENSLLHPPKRSDPVTEPCAPEGSAWVPCSRASTHLAFPPPCSGCCWCCNSMHNCIPGVSRWCLRSSGLHRHQQHRMQIYEYVTLRKV